MSLAKPRFAQKSSISWVSAIAPIADPSGPACYRTTECRHRDGLQEHRALSATREQTSHTYMLSGI
jgi:hypothetical protein